MKLQGVNNFVSVALVGTGCIPRADLADGSCNEFTFSLSVQKENVENFVSLYTRHIQMAAKHDIPEGLNYPSTEIPVQWSEP